MVWLLNALLAPSVLQLLLFIPPSHAATHHPLPLLLYYAPSRPTLAPLSYFTFPKPKLPLVFLHGS